MPRKYVRKKQRSTPQNPWLRQRDDYPADPAPDEPHLADFVRHEVPLFLRIAKWVHDSGIGRGAKLSEHEIAKSISNIALVYRQGQQIEARISEQSDLKIKGRLTAIERATLKVRSRGQLMRHGDFKLIAGASRLLQRMRGDNQRIGWGNWNYTRGKRGRSEIQRFVEQILQFIDPNRCDPPVNRYYAQVKKRLQKTMPG
jgi:hypothetical protein